MNFFFGLLVSKILPALLWTFLYKNYEIKHEGLYLIYHIKTDNQPIGIETTCHAPIVSLSERSDT